MKKKTKTRASVKARNKNMAKMCHGKNKNQQYDLKTKYGRNTDMQKILSIEAKEKKQKDEMRKMQKGKKD